MGRRPKPTALHKLEGTFNPTDHRDREFEPIPVGNLAELTPPAHLDEEQLTEWIWLVRHAPAGVLRWWDRDVLAHYVALRVRYLRACRAQDLLDRDQTLPYLTKSQHGPRISPYIRIQNHCIDAMTRLQAEMGMTPASRVRLAMRPEIAGTATEGTDQWSRLAQLRVITGGLGKIPPEPANPEPAQATPSTLRPGSKAPPTV